MISGQVPFPGTSFSEKARAHGKKEPIPLEERCPEVPAGLAFVVQKMMAKHPSERYQSAGEVAEALAPYVAGSSHSVIRMRETGRWPPGQHTMLAPRRGIRALPWVAGAAALMLAGLALLIAWPRLFPADAPNPNPGPIVKLPDAKPNPPKGTDAPNKEPIKKVDPVKKKEPIKPKVVTIENGLTVAKDGTGQFTTISATLDKVQPGQTIRVLDAATYAETLSIDRPSKQTSITLEAVKGATLMFPKGTLGMLISDVPGVTVRGFRCRHEGELRYMIGVGGGSFGLHLDRLDFKASNPLVSAVTLEVIEPGHEVGIIENCTIQGGGAGLRVSGFINFTRPSPCGSIVLRNNTILDASQAILITGSVRHVHVVGNRIGFAKLYAIQLENLLPGADDILIANNSTLECKAGFRFWDDAKKKNLPKNIQIVNNLFLGGPDANLIFLDSGGSMSEVAGPGDAAVLLKAWRWSCNWRETRGPKGDDIFSKSWIPVAPGDTRQDRIAVLSRAVGSPEFIRPAKDSPLATKGAGGDLPGYVGAMPPDGIAWDWSEVWQARVKKKNGK